jgi:hypothetical protein
MGWLATAVGIVGKIVGVGNNEANTAQLEAQVTADKKKIKTQKTIIWVSLLTVITLAMVLIFKKKKIKK